MNPLRIRAESYRTFERVELDLPQGCVGIMGPNGSGKSSIVNILDLALFGPDGRSWAPYLTVGASGTELMVELEFEHAEMYRVRRGYSARGAGKSTLDLEKAVPDYTVDDLRAGIALAAKGIDPGLYHDRWEPMTLGTAKDTQALLEQILGFTRRTLRASSLLLQGDGAAFTEADPRDRKRILADTLGLDRFETLLSAVRRDKRAAEQEIARVEGRLEGVTAEQLDEQQGQLEHEIANLEQREVTGAEVLARLEQDLEQATKAYLAAQTAEGERTAAEARVRAAQTELQAKTQLGRDAAAAADHAQTARDELVSLPTETHAAELEQREQELTLAHERHREAVRAHDETLRVRELKLAEHRAIVAQARAAADKAVELDERIRHLEDGHLDSCPTCKQLLGEEARRETIRSLSAQSQQHIDDARALDEQAKAIVEATPAEPARPEPFTRAGELLDVKEHLRVAREASLQRSRLEERLAGYERAISAAAAAEYLADVAAAEQELQAAQTEHAGLPPAGDFEQLRAAAVAANTRVTQRRAELEQTRREQAVTRERLGQHEQRAAQHQQDLEERRRQHAIVDILQILERAYGPDGIPALILENSALPQIENEANRVLAGLPMSDGETFRIELRTQRATKTGDLRDALDIVVFKQAGELPYEHFSGGEKTRINIALRLALASLLATRRGADCKIVAIDEPDGLDADGKEHLLEILRDLEQKGVEKLYLISHDQALRDGFDQQLVVVKENGVSRVGTPAEPVAVAA